MMEDVSTGAILTSGALVAGWILLTLLAPSFRRRHSTAAFWITVVTGIPLLGWLTWTWGPGIGVVVFALGMVLLRRAPRDNPSRMPAE